MPTIITRSKRELLAIDFLFALAKWMSEMNLSRDGATFWLATVIYDFEGEIRTPEGELVEPDDELGYGEDNSWNTAMKKRANKTPKRRPRASLYTRLLLWDAAAKIVQKPIKIDQADL